MAINPSPEACYAVWANRNFQLKDGACDDVPVSKSSSVHRENINQLCYELSGGDLPYDAFSYLVDKEVRSYSDIMDGNGK